MIEPKKIVREKLYHNKHKYRLNVVVEELRWFWPRWWSSTISDGIELSPSKIKMVESLIKFMRKYRQHEYFKKATVRKAHTAFTLYTSELEVAKELYDIIDKNNKANDVKIEFTEIADFVPEGVKYFVKTPPGNYRVYFKNIYGAPISLKDDLGEFFKQSQSFRPSRLLKDSLYDESRYNFRNFWVEKQHYFDCDNEADISYFMLMYPELVRKTYKLEQKPASTNI